ncbi:hypothetical protein SAMN05443144_112100 [Fodinibius roseus]|uniref:Uncharacterized protein n=1 Tax=Fodinibius roseus TaxID=1194090 RepID=A0A1M5E1W8_9BACT|nr:hypothetical protein [Fodinibius roseus]SHF73124.1 hypothetical protein SAMN05443144_112100 [Fodinibius roseus]
MTSETATPSLDSEELLPFFKYSLYDLYTQTQADNYSNSLFFFI